MNKGNTQIPMKYGVNGSQGRSRKADKVPVTRSKFSHRSLILIAFFEVGKSKPPFNPPLKFTDFSVHLGSRGGAGQHLPE